MKELYFDNMSDLDNTRLGFEIDDEIKQLSTIITNANTLTFGMENELVEPSVAMLAYSLGVSFENQLVPFQSENINTKFDMPERTKKVQSFLKKIVRFIKKIIMKTFNFIVFLFRKAMKIYIKAYDVGYVFDMFGKDKRNKKLFEHIIINGVEKSNELVQKWNNDKKLTNEYGNAPYISEEVYGLAVSSITMNESFTSYVPSGAGSVKLARELKSFLEDDGMVTVSAADNYGSKNVLSTATLNGDKVKLQYNQVNFEDNGEFVTDINISKAEIKEVDRVKRVGFRATIYDVMENTFRDFSSYVVAIDGDELSDVNVDKLLEKIRISLNLDAKNIADYQAAQMLIIGATNLFKLINTSAVNRIREINAITSIMTVTNIFANDEKYTKALLEA